MPLFSEGIDAALTQLGTALGGVVLTLVAVRKKLTENKVETTLLEKLGKERDRAEERLQEMIDAREKQFGACEERVRSLSEQVLDLRLANGRLQQELAKHDPAAAERLLVLQVRPVPPGPGDEPP